jgi:hypothetical protein
MAEGLLPIASAIWAIVNPDSFICLILASLPGVNQLFDLGVAYSLVDSGSATARS